MPEGHGPHHEPSVARKVALACLLRVEKGDQANQALARQFGRGDLSPADRRLATELTYGTVRMQLEIDYILSRFLKRDLRHLPAGVRAALRIGAYQLLHLTRVPRRAAVWESVELVRGLGEASLAKMTNAVLHRVDPELLPPWPDEPVEALATRFSHPVWLTRRWLDQYGPERTGALLAYDNEAPPVTVRVGLGASVDQVIGAIRDRAREEGGSVRDLVIERTAHSRRGLRLRGAGEASALPLFREGMLTVQDEASMLAADLLAPRSGETVVDACAGMGTKTWGLLEMVAGAGTAGPRGQRSAGKVLSLDRSGGKIRELLREAHRRGILVETPVPDLGGRGGGDPDQDIPTRREGAEEAHPAPLIAATADATRLRSLVAGLGIVPDRILLDAPCTGLGVLRRRPELRYRRRPEDASKLHGLQVALLQAALGAVRVGGEVLYVTCSTEPIEDEAVVRDAVSGDGADFEAEVLPLGPRTPPGLQTFLDPEGCLRLFGPETGTDSFFFALLTRTA